MKLVSERAENIEEKEKMIVTSIFSFSRNVLKSVFLSDDKSRSCMVKGLNVRCIICFQIKQVLVRSARIAQLVRAVDLKTRGCGFNSRADQPNNY